MVTKTNVLTKLMPKPLSMYKRNAVPLKTKWKKRILRCGSRATPPPPPGFCICIGCCGMIGCWLLLAMLPDVASVVAKGFIEYVTASRRRAAHEDLGGWGAMGGERTPARRWPVAHPFC